MSVPAPADSVSRRPQEQECSARHDAAALSWIRAIFCASGFAAILYQIVWQRVLFTVFGVNIEAVTVVVAAFLAGLGLGSLIGGRLSNGSDTALLRRFAYLELSIGLFGAISLTFYRWVGSLTGALPSLPRGALVALLAMAPTTLMGATLPLLVAYLVRRSRNVGSTVGSLYFVNTAGSALAAFAAALFLLPTVGELRTTLTAAVVNIAVGGSALLRAKSVDQKR